MKQSICGFFNKSCSRSRLLVVSVHEEKKTCLQRSQSEKSDYNALIKVGLWYKNMVATSWLDRATTCRSAAVSHACLVTVFGAGATNSVTQADK